MPEMNGNEPQLDREDIRLREQLQRAVRSQDVPPFLEARIRAQMNASARMPAWRHQLAAATAALMVVAGGVVAYQLGHLRVTRASQESFLVSVSDQVATILRVGLGDHIHCAFFRKFPKNPPPMEEFVAKMGADYSGLIPLVRKEVPEKYRLDIAHRCHYRDREFVHLVLRNGDQLMSLVIAKKQPGESFATEGLAPVLIEFETAFYQAGARDFQISSFESREHLVYFISDLPATANMRQMLAMAPAVKNFLAKLEA
jgi:hypothetical protein